MQILAETVGFEPTKELPLYTLSKRAPSTTRPRLRLVLSEFAFANRRSSIPQKTSLPLVATLPFRKRACFAISHSMKKLALYALCAAIIAFPALAQAPKEQEKKEIFPSPNEIVDKADAKDWVAIAPSDLLVMDLAPDAQGKPRRVVIQLMPPPFSQGWIGNMRKLAKAHWWDGTSVNRAQDNYVVQWGDASEKKPLPAGLVVVAESGYTLNELPTDFNPIGLVITRGKKLAFGHKGRLTVYQTANDSYVDRAGIYKGWPIGLNTKFVSDKGIRSKIWWPNARKKIDQYAPVHCYGMVGVGRNYSPDTGTGAELYTVIGHAPRHLDRNIALVGRIIEGMEHLSSLPRGTGPLGFYETPEERTAIQSVRLMSDMVEGTALPEYEYLSTESGAFAKYADARANRRDPFFIKPAGGADICNIPVPVRRVKAEK